MVHWACKKSSITKDLMQVILLALFFVFAPFAYPYYCQCINHNLVMACQNEANLISVSFTVIAWSISGREVFRRHVL